MNTKLTLDPLSSLLTIAFGRWISTTQNRLKKIQQCMMNVVNQPRAMQLLVG
jgi:hypothetical protein